MACKPSGLCFRQFILDFLFDLLLFLDVKVRNVDKPFDKCIISYGCFEAEVSYLEGAGVETLNPKSRLCLGQP